MRMTATNTSTATATPTDGDHTNDNGDCQDDDYQSDGDYKHHFRRHGDKTFVSNGKW